MTIQILALLQQTDHRTDPAQLTAPTTARHHLPQQGPCLYVPPQQQSSRSTRDDQQCDSTQSEQPRLRGNGLDARLGKAQPPLHIATAGLTPRTARIFCHGLLRCRGPIRHHIPEAPLALGIALAIHGHPQRLMVLRTIEQASQCTTACIAHKAQRVELAPPSSKTDFGAFVDPNDKGHPQRR